MFGFFIERKPCTICSLVFVFAVVLICSTGKFHDVKNISNVLSVNKLLDKFKQTIYLELFDSTLGNGNSCIFWNNICNSGENDNEGMYDDYLKISFE